MSDLCFRLSCVDLVLCRAEGDISWHLKVGASNGGWGGSTQSLHQGLKFKTRLNISVYEICLSMLLGLMAQSS